MKRTGTVPLAELMSALPRSRADRDVHMRSQTNKQDWFKIKNADVSAGEDTTEIYIYDEIGYWGTDAQSFVRQLMEVDSDKIDLHLNSPGGEVFDGVAIYNALKMHKADVTVYVDGLAASAASFISQAGDKIIMREASTMMIHDGSGLVWGNADEMREFAKVLDTISDNIAGIYATRTGDSTEKWRALMKEEVWYSAQEAVDAGLADTVSGKADKAENSWDLTIFNHAGRANAPAPKEVERRIVNRVKETSVTKPVKNHVEGDSEATPDAGEKEAQPASPAAPETEDAPAGGGASGGGEPLPESGPASTAPANKTAITTGGTFTFMLNGQPTSDLSTVQSHISSLEGFQNETQENNRKAFVKQLADDNKILASKMDEVEEFALALSPEMYEKWCASMSAVPVSSVLQSTPVDSTQGGQKKTPEADQIEIWEGVVMQHKRSGMTPDQIKNTASYNKLIAANPDFKL